MITFIGLLLFVIFLFLGALHIFWAFDGQWGTSGVFPTKNEHEEQKMPGKIPTLIVAIGLLAFGVLILRKANIVFFNIPSWLDTYGLRFLAAVFIMRVIGDFHYVGFFKKIKNTTFGRKDTRYYVPLCLTIGILLLILQFFPQ